LALQDTVSIEQARAVRAQHTRIESAWDLIIHGPAHRGANGAAMPTDEDDQNGLFFFNRPERGGYSAA